MAANTMKKDLRLYCSVATSVTFGSLALMLLRLTFEGCKRSLSTLVSWAVFNYFSRLYDRKDCLLLSFFSLLGRLVAFKGLPLRFYKHCYPLFKRYELFGKSCSLCSVQRMGFLKFVLTLRRFFVLALHSTGEGFGRFWFMLGSFFGWVGSLFGGPGSRSLVRRFVKSLYKNLGTGLNWFNVYGFFGVFLSVRLFFFVNFFLSLLVLVKYFSKLLKFKPFKVAISLVLVPCFVLVSGFSFLFYRFVFSVWYLVGSLVLAGTMYYTQTRRPLR